MSKCALCLAEMDTEEFLANEYLCDKCVEAGGTDADKATGGMGIDFDE